MQYLGKTVFVTSRHIDTHTHTDRGVSMCRCLHTVQHHNTYVLYACLNVCIRTLRSSCFAHFESQSWHIVVLTPPSRIDNSTISIVMCRHIAIKRGPVLLHQKPQILSYCLDSHAKNIYFARLLRHRCCRCNSSGVCASG